MIKDGIGRVVAPLMLLGSLLAVAGLYLNAQYPEYTKQIIYRVAGESALANRLPSEREAQELKRLEKIKALLISYENKLSLRDGKPFWGAATHMVELAFRGPADEVTLQRDGKDIFEFHRFSFGGSREPVVMEYLQNELICIHYLQREKSICNHGQSSYYPQGSFPYNYRVSVQQNQPGNNLSRGTGLQ